MALTTEDLSSIKSMMIETIQDTVPDIVTKIVDTKFDELAILMGQGFNEVHERFNKFESRMATSEQFVDEFKWKLHETATRADVEDLRVRVIRLEHQPRASV